MTDGIERMKVLGQADARIFELNLKLRGMPRRFAEAKKQLDAERTLLDEVRIPYEQLSEEIREREAGAKLADETIEKFEEHMKLVTTQKEYLAARKQVDEARKLSERLQNEVLERRIKQEELQPSLDERSERHGNVLEAYRGEEGNINAEREGLQAEIAVHAKVVEEQLAGMGGSAVQYYKRLLGGGKQPAVVAVTAGSCSGCNMTLPPQIYNQLLANNGNMFTCPTCSRIVYYQPPEGEESQDAAAG